REAGAASGQDGRLLIRIEVDGPDLARGDGVSELLELQASALWVDHPDHRTLRVVEQGCHGASRAALAHLAGLELDGAEGGADVAAPDQGRLREVVREEGGA